MKFERFEEIIVWQKSKELVIYIYSLFRNCPDSGFMHQIRRASISIMNNIAEGFERKTNKEFVRFLYMSKGSSGELRSMLYLALELKFISREEFENVYSKAVEISKMLSGLIKVL